MMKYIFILVLLLPAMACGTIRNLGSGDLPYVTVANYDTLRFTGTMVSSAAGGITISHHHIFIDGQGDTLYFDNDSGGSVVGIQVNEDSCTVRDLNLFQLGNGSSCDAINITHGGIGLTALNCSLIVRGTNNCQVIDSYGSGTQAYNIYLDSLDIWNYSTGYTSRMAYEGAAVRLELRNSSFTSPNFTAKIYRVYVHIAPHCGITIFGNDTSGYGLNYLMRDLEIAYCSTWTDHQNTMYPTWDGTTGHSSANAYGIMVRNSDGSMRIHDNYIGAGTSAGGSRGMMLEGINGSASDSALVYNNTIDINCGPDVNYTLARGTYVRSWAIRIRDIDNQLGRYLAFYNNDVTITIDTHSLVGAAYGTGAAGINLSETHTWDGHMSIHDNHFTVIANNTRAETNGDAVYFSANPIDSTIHFYNNVYQAVSSIFNIYQASGIDFVNDTFKFSTDTANAYTFELGNWAYPCTALTVTDGYYCSPAGPNDTLFNAGSESLAITRTGSSVNDCSAGSIIQRIKGVRK